MSGATAATIAAYAGAAAAVAGTAYSVYSGEKQAAAQKEARQQVEKQARDNAKAQDEATNRANQKRTDAMGALDAAQQAGKGGASGTLLTGPQGVANNALSLGRSTLLG